MDALLISFDLECTQTIRYLSSFSNRNSKSQASNLAILCLYKALSSLSTTFATLDVILQGISISPGKYMSA